MPEIRPFRALRYDPVRIADQALVVAPPYDVIEPAEHERLLARHPANIVRLDTPRAEPGDEPDACYRRAARILARWRSDGTLHKDPRPAIYVYEQRYRLPGSEVERTQRGFFGRVRLEPFGPGSGILPHERTLAGPIEDRYKLLRATGVNSSPVVGLYEDPAGDAETLLEGLAADPPVLDVADDDGVQHRLWVVAPDGGIAADAVTRLVARAAAGPITIADGHHRYETALRYRDERRMTRSCEEDPAFDYVLMLLLGTSGAGLTVLPTHRVVRGIGDRGVEALLDRAGELFDVRRAVDARDLEAGFGGAGPGHGGGGRFGFWTRLGGALMTARRASFEAYLPPGGEALRGLDVSILGAALERLAGVDAAAVAEGRVAYTKSVSEAIGWVDRSVDGADAAFLLEPTPVASIAAVAREGDVMPQKSTYFYPKALSGLVINPHEW